MPSSAARRWTNQMVFDLFSNTIAAAETLGCDADLAGELREKRSRLAPMQVGSWGQLQEWQQDWDNPEGSSPACFPPVGALSRTPDLGLYDSRSFRCGPHFVDSPGRRFDRMVDGLEGLPVGPFSGRKSCLQADYRPDPRRRANLSNRAEPIPICSMRIPRSRSTEISAVRPASPRCCCKATTG